MTTQVGLERNADDLTRAIGLILKLEKAAAHDPDMRNMAATCLLIAGAALMRTESRGGHFRSDYPTTQAAWARRTIVTLDEVRRHIAEQMPTTASITKSTAGHA
jgi:L-aspartate oxidase